MKMTKTLRVLVTLALAGAPLAACSDDAEGTDDPTGDASMAVVDMIHIPLCIPGDGHNHTGMDEDAGVDEEHSHATCGLQENCADVLTLADGLVVDGKDGNYSVEIKTHTSLGAMGNHWMANILDADGKKVTNVTAVLKTWSVDCVHDGPTPPDVIKADDNGMYMLMPVTAHGGPWEVRVMITDGEVPADTGTSAADHSGH